LDPALASGLAVAGAGPVSIPSRTLGHELHSSPVGRLTSTPKRGAATRSIAFDAAEVIEACASKVEPIDPKF